MQTRDNWSHRLGIQVATKTLLKGVTLVALGALYLANVLTFDMLVGVGLIVWGVVTLVTHN